MHFTKLWIFQADNVSWIWQDCIEIFVLVFVFVCVSSLWCLKGRIHKKYSMVIFLKFTPSVKQRFIDSSVSSLPAPDSLFSEIIFGKMRSDINCLVVTRWKCYECAAECCKLAQCWLASADLVAASPGQREREDWLWLNSELEICYWGLRHTF